MRRGGLASFLGIRSQEPVIDDELDILTVKVELSTQPAI